MRYREHIPSGLSLKAIEHNLIGFETLFNNGYGYGFDDLLKDLGHNDIQQEMQLKIDKAKQSLADVNKSLVEMYQDDPEKVLRIHSEISAIVDFLSSDVATVLSIKEPYIDCPGGD